MLILTLSIYIASITCPALAFPCRPALLNPPTLADTPPKQLCPTTPSSGHGQTGTLPKQLLPHHTLWVASPNTGFPHKGVGTQAGGLATTGGHMQPT